MWIIVDVMDWMLNLCIISCVGIGYDMVDVVVVIVWGIVVVNILSYCIEEVVVYMIVMIMM